MKLSIATILSLTTTAVTSVQGSMLRGMNKQGVVTNTAAAATTTTTIGYHQDEHGCLLSAGFSWCNSLQICYRPWETTCVDGISDGNSSLSSSDVQQQVAVGDSQNEHGCLFSAGYFWCEAISGCLREWENPCPTTTTSTTVAAAAAAAAATIVSTVTKKIDTILGDSRDEYGCLLSAGYSWCESSKSCLREWETPCPIITTSSRSRSTSRSRSRSTWNEVALLGNKRDDHGCNLSAGYSWCNSSKSCHRPWETPSCHDDHDDNDNNNNNNNNNIDNINIGNNIVVA